jgi:alpha-glucosidase
MFKDFTIYFLFVAIIGIYSCVEKMAEVQEVKSPNGNLVLNFFMNEGIPTYNIAYKNQLLIDNSKLGFDSKSISLKDNLSILYSKRASGNVELLQIDKDRTAKYNELQVELIQTVEPYGKLEIVFQVYDEGFGFRYIVPGNAVKDQFLMELTEFNFIHNYKAWWIPVNADKNGQEPLFKNTNLYDVKESIQMPLSLVLGDSLLVRVHESTILGDTVMTLKHLSIGRMKCDLVLYTGEPEAANAPLVTPWRKVQIIEKVGDSNGSFLQNSKSVKKN